MSTISVNEDALLAAYKAAGLGEQEIAKAMAGLRNARTTVAPTVVVNQGDERKFGDVSIFKTHANGYRKAGIGLWAADLPAFIAALQEAQATLEKQAKAEEKAT